MRTSTIATSGSSRATAASNSTASPAVATTSCPRSASSRVRPSRRSTESSAITIRTAAPRSSSSRRRAGTPPRRRRRPPPLGLRARRALIPLQRRRHRGRRRRSRSAGTRSTEWTSTDAVCASACFATFVSASATMKYAFASTEAGGRTGTSTSSATGIGARAASADNAASRPRSSSTAGCRPRTRSRSSTIAALRLVVGLADELAGLSRIVVELLEREAEIHPEPHEPLLGAVVEVALDPAALVDRSIDRAGTRLLQLLDPSILRGGAEQGLHEHPVEQRERADDPRGREREQQADRADRGDLPPRVQVAVVPAAQGRCREAPRRRAAGRAPEARPTRSRRPRRS